MRHCVLTRSCRPSLAVSRRHFGCLLGGWGRLMTPGISACHQNSEDQVTLSSSDAHFFFFLPCVTCLQGLKLCRDIIIRLCCCLGVKAIFSLPFQLMTVTCLLLSSLYNYLLWLRPVVKSFRTTSVLLYLLFSLFVRKDMYCVTANSELGATY